MIITLDVLPIFGFLKRFLVLLSLIFSVNIQAVTINQKFDRWFVNIYPCSHIFGVSAQDSLGAACSYCAGLRKQSLAGVNQTDYDSGSCTFNVQSWGTVGPFAAYAWGRCPAGYLFGGNGTCVSGGHSSTKESVSGLDAGLPASIGFTPQGKMCTGGYVGDPINPGTGNAFQKHIDYTSNTAYPLIFARYYNSAEEFEPADIGVKWRHSYSRSISREADPDRRDIAIAMRPDGKSLVFESTDGVNWTSMVDKSVTLSYLYDAQQQVIGWTFTNNDDTTEFFDQAGRLTKIQSRVGHTLTVHRDDAGKLSSVSDDFGRMLAFLRDSQGRISALIDPAGKTIAYGYNTSNGLESVTYQDSAVRHYLYDEADHVSTSSKYSSLLTGILDENGDRWVTTKYDNLGRAIEVFEGSAANRFQITYPTSSTNRPMIVDPLGFTRWFRYSNYNGVVKVTESLEGGDKAARGHCEYSTMEYNANGYLTRGKSYNNAAKYTEFTRDDRGLELEKREAVGTSMERTTSTTWLSSYRLPTLVQEQGRSTEYTYFPNGDLQSKTITDESTGISKTRQYAYISPGFIQSIDGPRTGVQDIIQLEYDTSGNVSKLTNEVGHATLFRDYDAHGNVGTIVDPNGVATSLQYDERQRITSVSKLNAVWSFQYDSVGNMISVSGPALFSMTFGYDTAHRLIKISDAQNNEIRYTLNGLGGIEKQEAYVAGSLVASHTSERIFNSLGQIARLVGQAGQQTDLQVDKAGNPISSNQLSESGTLSTNYAIDALSRVTAITDPQNGTTSFTYNALSDLVSVTDSKNLTTSYVKDAFGNTLAVSSPGTGTTTIEVDVGGNPIQIVDEAGRTAVMGYDAAGRLVSKHYPQDPSRNIDYHYDGVNLPLGTPNSIGRLTGIDSHGSDEKYYYDARGNIAKVESIRGGHTYTLEYRYNLLNKIVGITYPSGNELILGYDVVGNVNSASVVRGSDSTSILNYAQYEPFGNWNRLEFGSGLVIDRTFDADGRVANIDANVGYRRDYLFDLRNFIGSVTDAQTGTVLHDYNYSPLGELTLDNSISGALIYSYVGSSGNRSSKTVSGVITTYSYDIATNQVVQSVSGGDAVSYTYDDSGRVIAIVGSGTPTATLDYGVDGRIKRFSKAVVTADYSYNGLSQRTSKLVTTYSEVDPQPEGYPVAERTEYGYGAGGQLLWEHELDTAVVREYYWLGDQLIATYSGPYDYSVGEFYYYVTDHLGTPAKVVDSNNAVVWEAEYLPFGKAEIAQEALENNIRFPGQYYDSESGFHYNWYRYYDPSLGRYVQSDPIGLQGGMNTYAYVGGNPLSFIDPLGLAGCYVGYPGYPITIPGTSTKVPLTHAGVLSYDSAGHTRYYEYGRYGSDFGSVRRRTIPDLEIGRDGQPTPESWAKLMKALNDIGHGTEAETSCEADANADKVNEFAENRMNDPNRAPYSWMPWSFNTCTTFANDALGAGL